MPTVSARGASTRDEFLPAEGHASAAAASVRVSVAGGHSSTVNVPAGRTVGFNPILELSLGQPARHIVGLQPVRHLSAIVVTSFFRDRIGHGAWRSVHWLAYAAWPVALLHGIGSGTDSAAMWMLPIQAGCVAAVLGAAGWRLAVGRSNRSQLASVVARTGNPSSGRTSGGTAT